MKDLVKGATGAVIFIGVILVFLAMITPAPAERVLSPSAELLEKHYATKAILEQDDGVTHYNVNQESMNEVGSGFGSSGADSPDIEDHTGFIHYEVPVGAISESASTDDGLFVALGNLLVSSGTAFNPNVDQVGGTTGTYGVITGNPDGVRTTFVLAGTPTTGANTLAFLNGFLQIPDGDDYSLSGTTLTFTSAPLTGTIMVVMYD